MIIYVCSPFAGGKSKRKNIKLAKRLSREIALHGDVPITPYLLYPQFLDDRDSTERLIGLSCAFKILELCDELHYSLENGISEGMRIEIDRATILNIPVVEIK